MHLQYILQSNSHNFIAMLNPETSFHTIDTATMFRYSTHKNIPWNISEYRTPRLQVNAALQKEKRKWQTQKKGQKDGRHVTKRGFYMDYQLKVAKGIPSPHVHGEQKSWDFEKLRKKGSQLKVDRTLSKSTYLDFIELNQRNRKSPGVCTYNLQKSLKEKEEAMKSTKRPTSLGDRIFFYENTHTLSSLVPGAGNYCPHTISAHVSPDRKDYKYWVAKHKAENDKILKRQSVLPAPGTHSPLNTTLKTFEQLSQQLSHPTKRRYFGSDAKFQYTRQSKKKIIEKRPDPAVHSTIVEWKGKSVSPKKSTLHEVVWRGMGHSIYH